MNEQERLSALEVAINNEMQEREFYLANSSRTRNAMGKAVFDQLAREELEHAERLKEVHERWKKLDKWPATVPLKVSNTIIKDVLNSVIATVKGSPEGDVGDLEAVRRAIDFEAKGSKFYGDLRDAVTDPREKEFFDLLAMIEHEHYLSLKDIEEYFTDPEGWFRKMEHHTFDGG